MSKNLSAVKRDQVSLRNNIRNRNYKSAIKTLSKKMTLPYNSLDVIDYNQMSLLLSQVYSKIDKAVKRGIISKNSAARKKSLLASKLKSLKLI